MVVECNGGSGQVSELYFTWEYFVLVVIVLFCVWYLIVTMLIGWRYSMAALKFETILLKNTTDLEILLFAFIDVQSVGLQVNKAQVNLGAQVKRFHYPCHVARDSIDFDSRFLYQVNILF